MQLEKPKPEKTVQAGIHRADEPLPGTLTFVLALGVKASPWCRHVDLDRDAGRCRIHRVVRAWPQPGISRLVYENLLAKA